MKIEDLRSEKGGGRAKVAATVIWEDCDRPTHEVYFETDEAFADGLSCNPHAFLLDRPALDFCSDLSPLPGPDDLCFGRNLYDSRCPLSA